jgi:hypothetical protein
MVKMKRIDDPFDAADTAHPVQEEHTPTDLTLRLAARLPVVGALAEAVIEAREYLSAKSTNERLEALISAVNEKVDALSGDVHSVKQTVADIESRQQSREFTSAFRQACIETVLTGERQKIERFAAVLAGSVASDEWPYLSGDLPSFVKALAQLGEKDMQALRILHNTYRDVTKVYPNLNDPNPFTEKAKELLKGAEGEGFHPDDFYAHCRRLEGFGLAMEVPRNPSRMGIGEYCFRPTLMGLRLARLLSN